MEHSSDLDMDGEGFFKIPTSNGGSETTNIHSHNEDRSFPGNHKRNASNHEIDAVSGTKRPRINVDEQQASVNVIYNSLTRESKQKLEELLQQWSEWHTRHHSSSSDSKGELESGEGTYFPALHVGVDKHSAVSFWIDGQTSNSQSKESIAVDSSSTPLYDRGYSFCLDGSSKVDGGLEIVDGSRCFNCGSYSHALKECRKPRDNAAVDSARKQHKARRNLNPSSRNPTRYYQDTPRGKFDGLRPGVLDAETRKLLGIGELDPPPWLNRMREMGYPPGYLDPEDDDQPSGLQIFGDEAVKQETEDMEVLHKDLPLPTPVSPPPPPPPDSPPPPPPPPPEPPRKMSVQFPGVNAPIPENADEWRWGAKPLNFDSPNPRSYNSTQPTNKPHYHQQRWTHDYSDIGPPGVDRGSSPLVSTFSRWCTGHDSMSPSYERSLYERSRRSPLIHQTPSLNHANYRLTPFPYHQEHHHHSWR